MKFLLSIFLVAIFEEKITAKKIERNSGWASTSVLDIVEVQSKYSKTRSKTYRIPIELTKCSLNGKSSDRCLSLCRVNDQHYWSSNLTRTKTLIF